jgi:hypothetical protein
MFVQVFKDQKPKIVQKKTIAINPTTQGRPLPIPSGIGQRVKIKVNRVVIDQGDRKEIPLELNTEQPEAFMNLVTANEPNPLVTVCKIIYALQAIKTDDENVPQLIEQCLAYRNFILEDNSISESVIDVAGKGYVDTENATDSDLFEINAMIVSKAKEIILRLNFLASCNDIFTRMDEVTRIGEEVFALGMYASKKLVGNPVGPIGAFAVGGFGRKELAPGSDLDIGIMGTPDDAKTIRKYLTVIGSFIFMLQKEMAKIHEVVEGANPPFGADLGWINGGGLDFFTPKEIVQNNVKKGKAELGDIRWIPMQLTGEKDIADEFVKQKETQIAPLMEIINPSTMRSDLALGNLFFIQEGVIYDVKDPYLRYITICIQKLSIRYSVKEESTIERIKKMTEVKILPPDIGVNLLRAFLILTRIRHELHQVYHGEGDFFRMQSSKDIINTKERVEGNFQYIVGLSVHAKSDTESPYPDGVALLSSGKVAEVNQGIESINAFLKHLPSV